MYVYMYDMPAHITCRTHTCTHAYTLTHIHNHTFTFGETTSNVGDMYAIRMKSERAQFSASVLPMYYELFVKKKSDRETEQD